MNDFLDHLANDQYQKMHEVKKVEDVQVEDAENIKLKDMDSTDEINIDYIIDLTEE